MDNLIETFKEGWLDEDPRVVFAVLSGIVTEYGKFNYGISSLLLLF